MQKPLFCIEFSKWQILRQGIINIFLIFYTFFNSFSYKNTVNWIFKFNQSITLRHINGIHFICSSLSFEHSKMVCLLHNLNLKPTGIRTGGCFILVGFTLVLLYVVEKYSARHQLLLWRQIVKLKIWRIKIDGKF